MNENDEAMNGMTSRTNLKMKSNSNLNSEEKQLNFTLKYLLFLFNIHNY